MPQDSWWANNWLKVVGVFVALLIITPVIFNYWMAPMIFEQNRQAGEDIARDTIDSEKALQDYREFRDLYYDIKSAREQLENYKEQEEQFHETYGNDPQEWSRSAETRHGRIHDRITGQKNQISSLVAEYNAMSADATTSLYQCYLPYNIQDKMYIADASGVEYKEGANQGDAPPADDVDPSECKFSEAPTASDTT
jgi:hypothetical protein